MTSTELPFGHPNPAFEELVTVLGEINCGMAEDPLGRFAINAIVAMIVVDANMMQKENGVFSRVSPHLYTCSSTTLLSKYVKALGVESNIGEVTCGY